MASTLAEKIIARAAGRERVRPGETVVCRVDLAMIHDSGGPRRIAPRLKELGASVADPDRVVVVSDHFVPAVDIESARILKLTRDWVRETGVEKFHDMEGICHVIMAEQGYLAPGMFVAGGDSHSTTGGAFGCYMAGYGATEMAAILASGETWIVVPETRVVHIQGAFPGGVCAKDVMLHLCAEIGMEHSFEVIEFRGDTVAAMSMSERMVLCNMAAELGADCGMICADQVTLDALFGAGQEPAADALHWRSDPEASLCAEHALDVRALAPQVAAPHSPANSAPVAEHEGTPVQQAYIGACVGAKLEDLHNAAALLRGRRVAPGCRLLVAPASQQCTRAAAADGTLAALTEAGAILLPSGCGACAGLGAGVLAAGETCISSTNRNFPGRMGSPEARVYLASPYTVAASALAGRVCDPREFLEGAPH